MLRHYQLDISALTKTERYQHAINAMDGGMSSREAGERYLVARESLRLRFHGLRPIECRPGPQLLYINDEADAGLLEVIEFRATRGMCMGTSQFRELDRQAALATSLKPVPANFPGVKWVQRWVKRHSDTISYQKGQILDAKRAECSNEDTVRYYFGNLSEAVAALGLEAEPSRIWNCDETGTTAQGSGAERVLCPKGRGANVRRSSDRENVSMLGCINAAGDRMPPMFIYAGAQRKMEWLKGTPVGAVSAVTESSNINTELFLKWLGWFVSMLPAARPQLLVLDGHFAHVSLAAVEFAETHGVHLFVLPAHTSHFLQPLDVAVFQPFKSLYNAEIKQFPLLGGGLPVRDDIAAMVRVPFESAFSPKNIKRGFRDSGIFPLSLEVMLQKMVGGAKGACANSRSSKSLVRHHAVLAPHFNGQIVSDRVKIAMERHGLQLDTLQVASLSLEMLLEPAVKPRPKGTFIGSDVSGGKLLTLEEMQQAVKVKEAAAEAKAKAKAEAAAEKAARRAAAAAAKEARKVAAVEGRMKCQAERELRRDESAKKRARRQVAATPAVPSVHVPEIVVAFADV